MNGESRKVGKGKTRNKKHRSKAEPKKPVSHDGKRRNRIVSIAKDIHANIVNPQVFINS
jgi:hypothetical protein